jgi:2-methylfumaryl-CoA isomerase
MGAERCGALGTFRPIYTYNYVAHLRTSLACMLPGPRQNALLWRGICMSETGIPAPWITISRMKGPVAPLEGVKILDLSTYVAGPSASMTLGQLGAEVVRIDPLGGANDTTRLPLDADGHSLYWASLNKQKQSIELNLRDDRGVDLVHQLLAHSGPDGGIVITNAIVNPRLSYDELRTTRPDLIMVHLTGHADGSPAVDYTVNTDTGLPLMTGPLGEPGPVNHVLPAWDLLAGLQAVVAVLAAERVRKATGLGQLVKLSLADVAATSMANLGYVADVVKNGSGRQRDGNYLFGSYGIDFACADGTRVMVVALTTRHWDRLVAMTGCAEAISELERARGADFSDEAQRFAARYEITEILAPWFSGHSHAEVCEQLNDAGVLWGRYRTIEELVSDGDSILGRSHLFDDVDFPAIGTLPTPRSTIQFDPAVSADVAPQPVGLPGGDTSTVLGAWLGLNASDVAALRSEKIVGGSDE